MFVLVAVHFHKISQFITVWSRLKGYIIFVSNEAESKLIKNYARRLIIDIQFRAKLQIMNIAFLHRMTNCLSNNSYVIITPYSSNGEWI